MTYRLLAAVLLAPCLLAAQMSLFVVEGGVERTVGESFSLGIVPAGDFTDTAFRLRNASTSTLNLNGLNVAGARFSFASLPKLPMDVPAGGTVDFTIRFHPLTPSVYSAYLNVNGVRMTILEGTAAASFVVSLADTSPPADLAAGDTIDFGIVTVGSRKARRLTISNPTSATLTVQSIAVAGDGFAGPAGIQAPLTLETGKNVSFEVVFEPKNAVFGQGTLEIDRRRFLLRGTGHEPSFPKPLVLVESQTLSGARQSKVAVRLEAKSQSAGTGELAMEFAAATPGQAVDPAQLFLATGKRSVAFTVTEGEDMARFGSRTETEFQTGTTAGTITFTAKLGSHVEKATVVIPAAAVVVDSVRCLRSANGLDLQIAAFDTSHSASRLTFTFFDAVGNPIAPGAIVVDAGNAFREYFGSAGFGGQFLLRAVFPVTGNVLQITAFEAELTNSIGVTRAPRTAIQQ
jgi:Abnormal spindle-like microcephaly-assoc'd, ASPM-SPD-2-Hydin